MHDTLPFLERDVFRVGSRDFFILILNQSAMTKPDSLLKQGSIHAVGNSEKQGAK